ncbi:MAG: tetratricopeptide repeat protein [Candidatus Omnitrophica bacterium]|nr:tetratricopeptide repeat protein [Candidatus Omnitrophota bacterium]MBU1924957.1 tetratricopeptide repeat protein [Candidatus Omnitrophota bacterium]
MLSESKAVNRKQMRYFLCLGLLAYLVIYGNSLFCGFMIDDNVLILENDLIRNIKLLPRAFLREYMAGYYRPIVVVSFALDYALWKLNPFGYHLTNISLHFLNSLLFFAFLYLLFKSFELAGLASILFAIHPINSTIINYVSDRGNLLAAFFMLNALIAFYYGLTKRKFWCYVLGFMCTVLALLSRENAVLLSLYLTGMLWVLSEKKSKNEAVILFTCVSFLALIYLLLRAVYLPLPAGVRIFPVPVSFEYVSAFGRMIVKYFSLTIWPQGVCFARSIPQDSGLYENILYVSLIVFCLAFLFYKFRKNRLILFSFLWFFTGALPLYTPMIYYRPEMGLVMQDSWIYFSSAGLFIIASAVLMSLKKISKNKRMNFFLIAVIFLSLASVSMADNILYTDAQVYCLYWLSLEPKNIIANWALGEYYCNINEYEKAVPYFQKALARVAFVKRGVVYRDKDRASKICNNLGVAFFQQGNPEEALKYYNAALKFEPKRKKAHYNIANVYLFKNNLDKAIFHYNEEVKNNFSHLPTHKALAVIYKKRGQLQEANDEIRILKFLKLNSKTGSGI